MPSVIHDGNEFIDLPEAPSTTNNRGMQDPYGISQNRTIVEEEEESNGTWDLPPEMLFRATPSRISEKRNMV